MTQNAGRRRSGRLLSGMIVTVIALGLVVAAVVVLDGVLRSQAETSVRSEILRRLPEGTTGDMHVRIGGFSFLSQLASGRFERVELTSENLAVQAVPLQAQVVARGVPTDMTMPIEHVSLQVTVDQQALNSFVDLPQAADLQLGDGTVTYTSSLLGLNSRYRVTAAVDLQWPRIMFAAKSVGLGNGSGALDIGLGPVSFPVCAARYLPAGVIVDEVQITPGSLLVHATADDFVLSEESIRTLGSC